MLFFEQGNRGIIQRCTEGICTKYENDTFKTEGKLTIPITYQRYSYWQNHPLATSIVFVTIKAKKLQNPLD